MKAGHAGPPIDTVITFRLLAAARSPSLQALRHLLLRGRSSGAERKVANCYAGLADCPLARRLIKGQVDLREPIVSDL